MSIIISTLCACKQVLQRLPERTRVALLTFAAAVACFDLARPGCPAALALPGEGGFGAALLQLLQAGLNRHLVPLAACRERAVAAVQSLRCLILRHPPCMHIATLHSSSISLHKPAHLSGVVLPASIECRNFAIFIAWLPFLHPRRPHLGGVQRERLRCLGAAVEAGLHLVAAAAAAQSSNGTEEAGTAPWEGTPAQATMSRAAAPAADARMLIVTSGPATKARVLTSCCLKGPVSLKRIPEEFSCHHSTLASVSGQAGRKYAGTKVNIGDPA